MMKKCKGCGVTLQKENPNVQGFILNDGDFCERCFRIKHYNEYKKVVKTNEDFLPILKQINKTNDLVVFVLDLLNLPEKIDLIKENISNPILLVLTKRDLLPRSIQDKYLLSYVDKYRLNVVDKVIISSTKNNHLDDLLEKIKKYQISKNVYVIGYTNAGKSTMINSILKHYSDVSIEITTSMLTSTTLDMIEVPCFSNLTFLDTPGLLENGNILDILEPTKIKQILPKKEIKPITYQIKMPQTIFVDDLGEIEVKEQTNLIFYMSNTLKIDRVFQIKDRKNEGKRILIEKANTDVVILGLGFIRVLKPCTLNLFFKDVRVYTRASLIGKE